MNLKVPKKTNSFLIWSFNDILTVLLPLWLLCLISEFRYAPIDSFFAAPFYLSGNNWLGTGSFFFSAVLHKGGKYVAVAVAVSSLILFLLSYLKKFARLKPYRKVCLYVTLPISACALIISGLKSLSASPCPWSLPQYGGSGSAGKCFPAGHASSGFCLFSLYFAFRQLRVTRSWIFLILALALGWILGVGRQAQGAHFLSHSFATMFLDWAICALFYRLFFFPKVPVKIRQKPISALSYCLITAFSLTFIFNLPFFSKACSALKFSFSDLWLLAVCAFILFSAFFTVLRLLNHSFLIKVFSLFFTVCAAGAMYFNYQYGTIINSEMMRNALATDTAEAAELLTAKFFLEFAFLCLPQLYLTFFVPIKHSSFVRGIFQALVGLVIGVCFLMLNFQGVSSLIRSEPVLRNLISPVNVFSGTYKAVFKDGSTEVDAPRIVIDPKPALGASHKNDKGTLFIVVVGETARLANWGLAGYSRDTTPQLRARNVIPFSKTISCGTSTDVSLPCMFSRVGRDRYDRDRILKEESL
ncbi:MAG: phosphoethanolamine transferase domain-containing protein, partial [Parasutterella excrementihominis]